ncbi:MAG: hypothetical protein QM778_10315 [Myxococcales bacterium]
MPSDVILVLEYRLGEGGLLRRVEAVCRLTQTRSQLVWAFMLTWVPISLLSVAREFATGQREPLFYHAAMHVRLLVAVPMLLVLDHVFPKVCRHVLELLMQHGFVPPESQPRFECALRAAVRLTDSMLPEVLLALLGATVGVFSLLGHIPVNGFVLHAPLTPAQTWYALVDVPLFQFLLWRSLWRWLVWMRVLVSLSRLKLALVPTHPDRCGGIAFLRLPSVDYCAMLLFAATSVLCTEWGSRIDLGGSLSSFKPLLALFGTLATLVAFGPLLLFSPLLYKARREGLIEVSGMAAEAGRRFHRRWIEGRGCGSRAFGLEVQGLAATVSSYRETVEKMRVVMFDKRDMIKLLVATLLPLVPVMVTRVPKEDWLQLLSLFTGGWVG